MEKMPIALKKNKVTQITDVARLAGVSASAVSAALNNRPQISAATRERILKVVEKCNYVPQRSARTLSSRRSFQLGFLLSSKVTLGLANSYYSLMLAGVSEVCKQHDYHMVVTTYDLSSLNRFIRPVGAWQRNVDGIILAGDTDLAVIRELQAAETPFIVIGGDYPADVLCLRLDVAGTIEEILRYFYCLNHRRILVPYHYRDTRRIYEQVLAMLAETGQCPDLQVELEFYAGEDEFRVGDALALHWLQEPERFTALIASDQLGIGFLRTLLRHGKSCPQDISLVTAESSLSSNSVVPMTATDDRSYELGKIAAENILALLEKRRTLAEVQQVLTDNFRPAKLIRRESCGPAPNC